MARGRGRPRSSACTPPGEPGRFPIESEAASAPGSPETEEPFEYPEEPQPQKEPPVREVPLPPGVTMEQMVQWANLVMQASRAAPLNPKPARAAAASRAGSQPQERPAQVR